MPVVARGVIEVKGKGTMSTYWVATLEDPLPAPARLQPLPEADAPADDGP